MAMDVIVVAVIKSVKQIGYKGPLVNDWRLCKALTYGSTDVNYHNLVSFLINEIQFFRKLKRPSGTLKFSHDPSTFSKEMGALMVKMRCPYKVLTKGNEYKFADFAMILHFLITELMTEKILFKKAYVKKINVKPLYGDYLLQIIKTLKLALPPTNITAETLLQKIYFCIKNILKHMPPYIIGNHIYKNSLNNEQWKILDEVHKEIQEEYTVRRQIILTRLELTLQSFQFSKKVEGKEDLLEDINRRRRLLSAASDVDISHFLIAREDLVIIQKVSDIKQCKSRSTVYRVSMGPVPDRGGRINKNNPLAPEMPTWKPRSSQEGGGKRVYTATQGNGGRRGRRNRRGKRSMQSRKNRRIKQYRFK